MFRKFYKNLICTFALCVSLAAGANSTAAQTTAFTYQGRLTDSSVAQPTNGTYDMQFRIYTAASGGAQQGITVTRTGVSVVGGVFTVQVDPTIAPFVTGENRFLEIAVRLNGSGTGYTTLAPRQQITGVPYSSVGAFAFNAQSAQNADALGNVPANQFVQTNDSRLTDTRTPTAGSTNYVQNSATTQAGTTNFNINGDGTLGGVLTANNVVAVGGFFGSGSNIVSLNASNISSGTLSTARIPNLDASKITTGTFTDTRLSSNIPRLNAANLFTNNISVQGDLSVGGAMTGNGSGLTSLNAANLSTGTVSDARLSSNIPRLNAANQTFTGNQTINGNVSQPLTANGLPKAMILLSYDIDNETYGIARCYNALTGSVIVPCGFTITDDINGFKIDLGFQVNNRFILSSESGFGSGEAYTLLSVPNSIYVTDSVDKLAIIVY